MKTNSKQGLIGVISLIIIAVGLLAYFKVDVRSITERPEIKATVTYANEHAQDFWNTYLKAEVIGGIKFISDHHMINKTISFSLSAWQKVKAAGDSLNHL